MNYPFKLLPAAKDYLWGGTRLNDDFEKNIDMMPLAETWECSTHPDGPSVVATGVFQGQALTQVLKAHKEFLGTHPHAAAEGNPLPILIKFIDAKKDLSVQVHPSDEYAADYENGQLGKTEMWYVLDATKDASLVYGFNRDITEDELRKGLKEGTVGKYLQKITVEKDDVFYVEAGTVHAIGAGSLVAEIQENSNLTYRMFDYKRVDKNGQYRELHIEKAIAAAKRTRSAKPRQPMRVLKYRRGCASELLCRCRYFEVERWLLNTERIHELVEFQTGSSSFEVLLCTQGCGILFTDDEHGMPENIPIFKGDCIFVPADSCKLKIHGKMQMLKVRC
jgi:mannose-6-phosphate isomerase